MELNMLKEIRGDPYKVSMKRTRKELNQRRENQLDTQSIESKSESGEKS